MAVKRVVLAGLALLMCAAAVYGYMASRREQIYRQLIDRGEAALATDDTFAAIEAFSGAIALQGDSMLGYVKRGETYRRRNQLEDAMPDLLKASELDPLAPRPLELLGDVNHALGRFGRATERYRAYIKLDDRSPRVLYKLALSHYSAGQPAFAVQALTQAIAIDEALAEAHYLLGLTYRDLRRSRDSLRALERAVKLTPAMLLAREELAELYGRLGRTDAQIAQLEAVVALDPGASREVALGVAYAQAGRFDRAVTTLGHAAERYPDHSYTYVALGRLWLETAQTRGDRGDLSKALGALDGAVATDGSSEALMLFGRALLLARDEELAERMLMRASEKLPADPLAFFYLAEAAERRGHSEIARRALLDYRALNGEDRDPRRAAALAIRIADLSMKMADIPTALAWYRRGINGHSEPALLVRFADAQSKAGHVDAARETLETVLTRDPSNRTARIALDRLNRRLSPATESAQGPLTS